MWGVRPIVHPDLHRGSAMKRHTVVFITSTPSSSAAALGDMRPGVELVVENVERLNCPIDYLIDHVRFFRR